MEITITNQSSSAIEQLIELCQPQPTENQQILSTPSFEDLSRITPLDDSEQHELDSETITINFPTIKAYNFGKSKPLINDFVIAVDCSVLHLGRLSGGGTAFALRCAATCYIGKQLHVLRYNTGALFINSQNKLQIFRYIGGKLGKDDLYIQKDATTGKLIPRQNAVDTINQMQDRCRNFVERMVQEEAIAILCENGGGLLLIDGALTVSYDTPRNYINSLLNKARNNGVDICAVSKKSNIIIGEIPIDSMFDSYQTFVGYAPLLQALTEQRNAYSKTEGRAPKDITAGTEIFAVRFGFGPPGITYRVDTSKSYGSLDHEIINNVYNRCQIYGGYPKPLIEAHHYTTFLGGEALNLLADLVVRANVRVKEEPNMGVIFGPFGTFGK